MPRLADMDDYKAGNFGYSAVKMDKLGASVYTLVTIIVDESGSVSSFKSDLDACIKTALESCKYSPRVDNLMVRLVAFSDAEREVHGFKLLSECDLSDYDDIVKPTGATALFSTTESATRVTSDWGKKLRDQEFKANAITIIMTDGGNNMPGTTAAVKAALSQVRKDESLESIMTILIGVNVDDSLTQAALDTFKNDAGLDKFVVAKDAKPRTLAKVAEFVSRSVSAQSVAVGTGGPSQAINSLTI